MKMIMVVDTRWLYSVHEGDYGCGHKMVILCRGNRDGYGCEDADVDGSLLDEYLIILHMQLGPGEYTHMSTGSLPCAMESILDAIIASLNDSSSGPGLQPSDERPDHGV